MCPPTGVGIGVSKNASYILGSEVSIPCTSDFGVSSIDWLRNGQVVSTSDGSEGVLRIEMVTESDHGNLYTCRATAPFGVQEHNTTIQVEGII